MGIRFDKVLEQVARAANSRSDAGIENQERKVRRLEELIRAREVVGDRIAICLGLALAISAIALPVYAIHFSDGYAYLQNIESSIAFAKDAASPTRTADTGPATTGSVRRDAKNPEQSADGKKVVAENGKRPTQPYVIHKATGESALIEGPDGLWWVTPGMTLPGIGQVLSIERSDNGWVVVTSETMITQPAAKGASS